MTELPAMWTQVYDVSWLNTKTNLDVKRQSRLSLKVITNCVVSSDKHSISRMVVSDIGGHRQFTSFYIHEHCILFRYCCITASNSTITSKSKDWGFSSFICADRLHIRPIKWRYKRVSLFISIRTCVKALCHYRK